MSARVTTRANRQSGPPRAAHVGHVVNRASANSRPSAVASTGIINIDSQSPWDLTGSDGGQVSQPQVHAEIL